MKDADRDRLVKELGIVGAWIVIYGLVSIVSMSLSDAVGVPNSIVAAAYAVLCTAIIFFIKKKHKLAYYGFSPLKKLRPRRLLYFLPFVIVASVNLWSGLHIHDTPLQIVLITICMICVAFIEEVVFRSFLFKALQRKSLALAIAIPSALFGVIHLLNLFTGADLVETIFQVFYSTAFGFMCVVFFYKTDQIVPCIVCHAAGNVFSEFLPEHLSMAMQTIGCVVIVVVCAFYGIYLLKSNKEKGDSNRSDAGVEERSLEDKGKEPDYSGIIGKTVKGTVDRPIGTTHPRHPDMRYPINYGYVDGVFAEDGAEQDAYVFGTDKPLSHFEGKVIAVYHRFDDVEDKWIVSLDGEDIADEKILEDISFQEQFFHGRLYR